MIIGVDFDGTCVTHEFPYVGSSIGAEYALRTLQDLGCKFILNTIRSNKPIYRNGININTLDEAVLWFRKHAINLYGINENPDQHEWTNSTKPYCNYYIDDAAIGCPIIMDESISDRPFVDWDKVLFILKNKPDIAKLIKD